MIKVIPEIKQITHCNEHLYAVFNDGDTGGEYKEKVLAFALCDDGCVYPLVFDYEFGIGMPGYVDSAIRFELQDERERRTKNVR